MITTVITFKIAGDTEHVRKEKKVHKKIDGKLLQMNKTFSNLKMKQKDKITAWVYEEYKKYVTQNEKIPRGEADDSIIDAVLDKINEADIWIPAGEIVYDFCLKRGLELEYRYTEK